MAAKAAKKTAAKKATKAVAAIPVQAAAVPGTKRFVPKAKASVPVTELAGNGKAAAPQNGTRAFLIGVFAEPSTVQAAAARLRLEQPGDLDADGAEKKVRAFLEDVAVDAAYDARKKGDGDEALFKVVAVPVGAQRTASPKRRGEMKTKKTNKKATNGKQRSKGLVEALLTMMAKPVTKNVLVSGLNKKFPERTPESIRTTLNSLLTSYLPKRRGLKIKTEKKGDEITYHYILAKV